jgi:HEAT repeat protein
LLKDDAISIRLVAVDALGNVGSQKAIEPLVDVLEDSDAGIRKATATALDKLGWQLGRNVTGVVYWIAKQNFEKCVEAGAVALKPLITALKDRNLSVQIEAAHALGELRDAGAVEALVAMLEKRENSGAAVRALGKIGDPRAVEPLIAVLGTESDRHCLADTAEVLGQFGDPRAVKSLVAQRC